jgi:hypothetical protein
LEQLITILQDLKKDLRMMYIRNKLSMASLATGIGRHTGIETLFNTQQQLIKTATEVA